MASLSAACFMVGLVASTIAMAVPGSSPIYAIQGGGSGMETKGDYLENKIARGVYGTIDTTAKGVVGVFGVVADEVKQPNNNVKNSVKQARHSTTDSVTHSKHAASKVAWPFEDKAVVEEPRPKLSWIGGAKQEAAEERAGVRKFFSNPNNAFVAQGIAALLFGGLHLAKYDQFVGKLAEPLCKLFGLDWVAGAVGPHVRLVGAYLAGVFLSDVLAYKSNSAGFKRGKIWHEMGTCSAISALCIAELFSETPADVLPHALSALLFAGWYSYLSQEY